MRPIVPRKRRSPKPSTLISTGMPGASSGTSTGRHQRGELHVAQVDDRDQRRFEGDLLARLDVAFRDGAVERRRHRRVLERVLREAHLRLGRLDVAHRHVMARLAAVVRVLRNELLVEQPVVHRAGLLRQRKLGAGALQRALALGEPASRSEVSMRAIAAPP